MMLRTCGWAIVLAAAVAGSGSRVEAQSAWKDLKDSFLKDVRSSSPDKRAEAISALTGCRDLDLVDPFIRSLHNEEEDSVFSAAEDVLVVFAGSSDAVAVVVRHATDPKTPVPCQRWLFRVLAQGEADAARSGLAQGVQAPNDYVKLSALDAINDLPSSGPLFEAVKGALASSTLQVRISAVRAMTTCSDAKAVAGILIDQLAKEDGRLRQDIEVSLQKLIGGEGYGDVSYWRRSYEAWKFDNEKPEGPTGAGTQYARPMDAPPPTVPTYYRVPIYSKNIVFVIDRTGSMAKPIDPKLKEKVTPPKPPENVTESGPDGGQKEKGGEKGKKEKDPRDNLPWDKIKTKMDLAKEELKRTIQSLPPDVHFTVIYYNTKVDLMEDKLVPATPANKNRYCRMVDELIPSGGTDAFFEALKEALRISRKGAIGPGGKGPKGPGNMVSGIPPVVTLSENPQAAAPDTIFFLTDGSPTINEGSTCMPDDLTWKNFHEMLKVWEITKTTINTVGIGPHPRDLMGEIAMRTGGKYVDLSFDE